MIDLNEFGRKSLAVAKKRQENGAKLDADTMAMLKHCATEVVEAAEAYCPYKDLKELTSGGTDFEGMEEPDVAEESYLEHKANFTSELADIICCCLIIAGAEQIDMEKALLDCFAKNLSRASGTGDKK